MVSESEPKPRTVVLRVLIVEDTRARQELLRAVFREHAWILVHTAARAITLVRAYDFDLISLDYDLAGREKGDAVAAAIRASRNATTPVLVHSMNPQGAKRLVEELPQAVWIPLSKMAARNARVKRIREALRRGVPTNWEQVLHGGGGSDLA